MGEGKTGRGGGEGDGISGLSDGVSTAGSIGSRPTDPAPTVRTVGVGLKGFKWRTEPRGPGEVNGDGGGG